MVSLKPWDTHSLRKKVRTGLTCSPSFFDSYFHNKPTSSTNHHWRCIVIVLKALLLIINRQSRSCRCMTAWVLRSVWNYCIMLVNTCKKVRQKWYSLCSIILVVVVVQRGSGRDTSPLPLHRVDNISFFNRSESHCMEQNMNQFLSRWFISGLYRDFGPNTPERANLMPKRASPRDIWASSWSNENLTAEIIQRTRSNGQTHPDRGRCLGSLLFGAVIISLIWSTTRTRIMERG